MKKSTMKKIITMALATMTTMALISINVGAVESIEELKGNIASYSIDENGNIVLNYEDLISPFDTYPPTTGTSADIYLYGTGTTTVPNMHINEEITYNFSLNNTFTHDYADFLIGATNSYHTVYIYGEGGDSKRVNITVEGVTSGASDLGTEELVVNNSQYQKVEFTGFEYGELYAIKITPATPGSSVNGMIRVTGTLKY